MNKLGSNQDNDQMATEAAWESLQKQLVKEPANAQWARWSKQQHEQTDPGTNDGTVQEFNDIHTKDSVLGPLTAPIDKAVISPEEAYASRKKGWFRRNRKWAGGIAAASLLAAVLISPSGNQALAAILNQFHMQQLTVVKADDLQTMMNTVFTDGQSRDAINKFGAISRKSGTIHGDYTLKDAERLLNRKLIVPKNFDQSTEKVRVSESNELTLTLKVDEVNKTLKRLGATKLLPSSINGKPITLKLGEAVSYSNQTKLNGRGQFYNFSQQAIPVIEADPSISVAEALDAVMQFPLIPDYIKNNLRTSGMLDNGNIPLPIVTNGNADKLSIHGVEAVLSTNTYENGELGNTSYYYLVWVKDGQVYTVNGSGFKDRAAVVAFAEELIQQ